MTVAIGLLDPSGEVVLATDTRAVSEQRMVLRDGALKSVRVNDKAALAFAGDEAWAQSLAMNLFNVCPDVAGDDVLTYIEEHPEIRLDEAPFITAHRIGSILFRYRVEVEKGTIKQPDFQIVLVCLEDPVPAVYAWSKKCAWKMCRGEQSLAEPVFQIFGPGEPPKAVSVLSDTTKSVWARIHRVFEIHREICPCGVNMDIKIRRAVDGFAIRSLSEVFTPNNSPAPDPSVSASHADADT